MPDLLKYLENQFGSYNNAAQYLGYTARQYYNIRRQIELGESLKPHVEIRIMKKLLKASLQF